MRDPMCLPPTKNEISSCKLITVKPKKKIIGVNTEKKGPRNDPWCTIRNNSVYLLKLLFIFVLFHLSVRSDSINLKDLLVKQYAISFAMSTSQFKVTNAFDKSFKTTPTKPLSAKFFFLFSISDDKALLY